jgi:hypothetical protein
MDESRRLSANVGKAVLTGAGSRVRSELVNFGNIVPGVYTPSQLSIRSTSRSKTVWPALTRCSEIWPPEATGG